MGMYCTWLTFIFFSLQGCVSNQRSPIREESRCVNLSKPVQDRVSLIQQITTPKSVSTFKSSAFDSHQPELKYGRCQFFLFCLLSSRGIEPPRWRTYQSWVWFPLTRMMTGFAMRMMTSTSRGQHAPVHSSSHPVLPGIPTTGEFMCTLIVKTASANMAMRVKKRWSFILIIVPSTKVKSIRNPIIYHIPLSLVHRAQYKACPWLHDVFCTVLWQHWKHCWSCYIPSLFALQFHIVFICHHPEKPDGRWEKRTVESEIKPTAVTSFVLELITFSTLLVRSCFQTRFSGSIESSASEEPLLNVYVYMWSYQAGFTYILILKVTNKMH